jgi:hypothetical protein
MPVWLQTALAVFGATTPVLAGLVQISRRVSHTNQHFDPKSPVAMSIGTVPDRFRGLNDKIDSNHEAVMSAVAELRNDVATINTVKLPGIDQHQGLQDGRLEVLEGGRRGA